MASPSGGAILFSGGARLQPRRAGPLFFSFPSGFSGS